MRAQKLLSSMLMNESETISKALDLMVAAGWVRKYAHNVNKEIAVDWTDSGREVIGALYFIISEVGPEKLDQTLWWTMGALAIIKFGDSEAFVSHKIKKKDSPRRPRV
jgi:DNA-binding MarR family transcriptional regulator